MLEFAQVALQDGVKPTLEDAATSLASGISDYAAAKPTDSGTLKRLGQARTDVQTAVANLDGDDWADDTAVDVRAMKSAAKAARAAAELLA